MKCFGSPAIAVLILSVFSTSVLAEEQKPLREKTLVVWAAPDSLNQRGGTALTIDDLRDHFDGIVFGEREPKRWMAGSNGFARTQKDPGANAEETASTGTFVQMAIVYEKDKISLYRNATPYASYSIGDLPSFPPESIVMIGKRHLSAGSGATFTGSIDDARVYDRALSPAQIAALKPNEPSDPPPVAWWTFDSGETRDRMGRFAATITIGNVRVDGGKLVLKENGSTWIAMPKGSLPLAKLNVKPKPAKEDLTASQRKLREQMLADPYRATYHFVTPEGSCIPFDPNGAIFWNGEYHLGYIFTDRRGCCWGHVSSNDLLHWRWHSPSLFPAPGDPDRGIFSGNCFLNKDGEATMLYHGVGVGNCIATCGDPGLDRWTKLKSNPIVPNTKKGTPAHEKYQSWDPHGWLEGDTYYAVFGGTPPSIFKAKTLDKWEYVGPFFHHDMPDVDKFEDLSCPDFFKLGDKHMMLAISHPRGCRYYLGRWENERFHPERHGRMNWPGGTFFAPESLVDDRGRRIMWAWVLDRHLWDFWGGMGDWNGTMSLPRELSLADDGTLRIQPIEELTRLRKNEKSRKDFVIEDGKPLKLNDIAGDTIELELVLRPGKGVKRFGAKVYCSPDGKEQTPVLCDLEKKCLRVDVSKSSEKNIPYHTFVLAQGRVPKETGNPRVTAQEAPFELGDDETLTLRLFLDRSILEVFANDRQAICQRIYPANRDSVGVVLVAEGGDVEVESLRAWEMVPTNAW